MGIQKQYNYKSTINDHIKYTYRSLHVKHNKNKCNKKVSIKCHKMLQMEKSTNNDVLR